MGELAKHCNERYDIYHVNWFETYFSQIVAPFWIISVFNIYLQMTSEKKESSKEPMSRSNKKKRHPVWNLWNVFLTDSTKSTKQCHRTEAQLPKSIPAAFFVDTACAPRITAQRTAWKWNLSCCMFSSRPCLVPCWGKRIKKTPGDCWGLMLCTIGLNISSTYHPGNGSWISHPLREVGKIINSKVPLKRGYVSSLDTCRILVPGRSPRLPFLHPNSQWRLTRRLTTTADRKRAWKQQSQHK